ncbi:exodeoxyribonuclease VII small subunit [Sphingobacterium sp. lm-10]|uniref:exodeoxyribonuclease VII small subunit n=1 Tax=Sphingobacterium sp. lm-10 TaxID=2944904 RepID=UPI00202010D7|nr:exodeoxyribonuclease VII small subunit [Sphingobacterium sp. lm-10]MCL7988387.1 exodeoxyribonuclease VII small subunit [Sphingobacterium sp. lm-10]
MENKYTYEDAFAELQQIVSDMESGDIDIDRLSEKIKRASELLVICKAKLTSTEAEVQQLLAKLADDSAESSDA